MSELTQALDYMAEQMLKKEHSELGDTVTKTREERIMFINSVSTLQAHSEYLQRTTAWSAS